MHSYVCYCLQSSVSNKTYVGVTNNLKRRLRQHNGELVGGARYTKVGGPWSIVMLLGPFPTYQHALHLEWHWKHMAPKKVTGLHGRQVKLVSLLTLKIPWALSFYSAIPFPLVLPSHVKAVEKVENIIFP